jgi:hypothetical protein
MAVDPEVRREQNRINKQNERARKRAQAAGLPTPRPVTRYVKSQAVARAFNAKYDAKERRIAALEALPSVNSPTKNISVERDEEPSAAGTTRLGAKRQAEAFRESARAQKLDAVGRQRRKDLLGEVDNSGGRYNALSESQRGRLRDLNKRIAKGSNQSLAILFEYQGGAETHSSILSDLIYPDSEAIDDALGSLEEFAELADKARVMYAPKNITRLRV